MANWKRFYLTDNPFVVGSHIEPSNSDYRLNGRIFSKYGLETEYDRLKELIIKKKKYVCYVRSNETVRGTGKSALMAAVYWDIRLDNSLKDEFLPVWVTVEDYRSITHLLARVFDTLVSNGIVEKISTLVSDFSPASLKLAIKPRLSEPSPTVLLALSKLLSVDPIEAPTKYSNIRRSVPPVGHLELLKYILYLQSMVDKRRVVIFIDQFEEYVEFQRGFYKMQTLANDLKGIIRTCAETQLTTFVLTIHSASEFYLQEAGKDILSGAGYGEIKDTAVTVPKFAPPLRVKMAEEYIKHFRTSTAPKSLQPPFPFTDSALSLIATKTAEENIRVFISALQEILDEAIEEEDLRRIQSKYLTTTESSSLFSLNQ